MAKAKQAGRRVVKDALATQHSRRHGVAVKRGIAAARSVKKAALKARSRSIGMTAAQIAARLLFVAGGPSPQAFAAAAADPLVHGEGGLGT